MARNSTRNSRPAAAPAPEMLIDAHVPVTGAAPEAAASGPGERLPNGHPAPLTERIAYEVIGTLQMGRDKQGEAIVRNAGETVYEDELGEEMTRYLLARGEIADRNKPIPPSQASAAVAFDHLVDVAREIGLLRIRGGEFTFGERTYKGSIAFRAAVSLDRLKRAIVAEING